MIKGTSGNVIWDPGQYAFNKEGKKGITVIDPLVLAETAKIVTP